MKSNQNNSWHGPYQLVKLINETVKDKFQFPHGPIVYIVSERKWDSEPNVSSKILYIGMSGITNEHQSRARIGSLISNIIGFFNIQNNKRHSAGARIFEHCKKNGITPDKLFIAWCNSSNPKYQERKLISSLCPSINIK